MHWLYCSKVESDVAYIDALHGVIFITTIPDYNAPSTVLLENQKYISDTLYGVSFIAISVKTRLQRGERKKWNTFTNNPGSVVAKL